MGETLISFALFAFFNILLDITIARLGFADILLDVSLYLHAFVIQHFAGGFLDGTFGFIDPAIDLVFVDNRGVIWVFCGKSTKRTAYQDKARQ